MNKVLRYFTAMSIILLVLPVTVGAFSGSGSGTEADPYNISTLEELNETRDNLTAHYQLVDHISASDTENWNGGKGWEPIGNNLTASFNSSFNGRNYTIRNLYVDRGPSNYTGLFGYTGSGANITDIGLKKANITGKGYIGGLIGYSYYGGVSGSYVTGSVNGSKYVGGLVGWNNNGNVSGSHANVSVTGSRVGGLVGSNSGGGISNCYAIGSVDGGDYAGGLVGSNSGGSVSDSYSTGSVNDSNNLGGLIGSSSGSVSNSYYNNETSGQNDTGKGKPRNTSDMTWNYSSDTYEGWDMAQNGSATWLSGNYTYVKDNAGNTGYPALHWNEVELTVNSTEGGNVTQPGENTFTYVEGREVDLNTSSNSTYYFGGWTGDTDSMSDSTVSPTSITMDGNYSIKAYFAEDVTIVTPTSAPGLNPTLIIIAFIVASAFYLTKGNKGKHDSR